mgnify:CR=1 FL=1
MAPKSKDTTESTDEPKPKRVLTEEQIKKRKLRSNQVARRRGYRLLASKAGFTNNGDASSRDTTAHILRMGEITRACKWAPKLPGATAYESLTEFKIRTDLSHTPVTRNVAHAIRSGTEVFLRSVVNEAVLRTYEQGRTRVTGGTMWSVLRPYKNAFDFTWAAPLGVVRHAQTTVVGSGENETTAMSVLEGEEDDMKAEAKLLPKQVSYEKKMSDAANERKQKRAELMGSKKKAKTAAA